MEGWPNRWIDPSWTSPILMGLLVLMLCGLWRCVWREETRTCALYFMGFESIYLAWPWFTGVLRFAVEVLPFEFMFLTEGARFTFMESAGPAPCEAPEAHAEAMERVTGRNL